MLPKVWNKVVITKTFGENRAGICITYFRKLNNTELNFFRKKKFYVSISTQLFLFKKKHISFMLIIKNCRPSRVTCYFLFLLFSTSIVFISNLFFLLFQLLFTFQQKAENEFELKHLSDIWKIVVCLFVCLFFYQNFLCCSFHRLSWHFCTIAFYW